MTSVGQLQLIGPQFVGEAGVGQELARLAIVVLMDQDAAGQHAERALDDAHVLVQHQMMDVGAVEQRADRGNQHHIVGPNQFPQRDVLLCRLDAPGARQLRRIVNRFVPLPLQPRTFYCV